jgi:Fe-S-cluster-containing dehydrogenase component
MIEKKLHMDFVPTMCFQCNDPVCVHFCPVDAISKTENGTVTVDDGICTGCKLCIYGCPYGVMSYDEVKGVAGKCDLCDNCIHHGLEPSCTQHCLSGAMQF